MTTQTPDNILLAATVGSTAHGLAREGSDKDAMGIFAAPTLEVAGLDWHSRRESVVTHDPDSSYHEIGKFLKLAMGGNPTVIEFLYLDDYLVRTIEGNLLIELRESLINSHRVKDAYLGFAKSQISRYHRNIENGHPGAKTVRHAVRLARQGVEILTRGTLTVAVPDPEFYFKLDDMGTDDLVSLMHVEIAALDNVTEPFALDKFDRSVAVEYLASVRRSHL